MQVRSVGIVGAGTMGAGIAVTAAQAGLSVHLVDMAADAVDKAVEAARRTFARAVERGRMDAQGMQAALGRLSGGVSLDPLAAADLVIEAVFEDFAIKSEVFGRIDRVVRPDAIVATNTSCLRVGDLARSLSRPARFLGTHYFSPAAVNPVVEVVRGPATNERAVDAVLDFCRRTGKRPLLCRDAYGFAVNRFFCPYTNEAARCLDEGMATPAQIDRVAREALGAAAGPFFVMNIIKPQVNLHAIRNLAPLGSFYAPADSMVEIGDAGRNWEIGGPDGLDEDSAQAIAERLLGAIFLPVLQELDEAVATPTDIDLGAEQALKFGRPPCATMDMLGTTEVERLIQPLCALHGAALPESLRRIGRLGG